MKKAIIRPVSMGEAVKWGTGREVEREENYRAVGGIVMREVTWFTDGTGIGVQLEEGFAYSEYTWEPARYQIWVITYE